jgi:MFS family permease
VFGLMIAPSIGFYMVFLYLVQYMQDVGRIGLGDVNTLNMAVLLIVLPAAGLLSDRIGRRPIMLGALACLLLLAIPLFARLHSGHIGEILPRAIRPHPPGRHCAWASSRIARGAILDRSALHGGCRFL